MKPAEEGRRLSGHHRTTFAGISWDCSGEGMEKAEATARGEAAKQANGNGWRREHAWSFHHSCASQPPPPESPPKSPTQSRTEPCPRKTEGRIVSPEPGRGGSFGPNEPGGGREKSPPNSVLALRERSQAHGPWLQTRP
jgi:hypothetical protein